MKSGKFKFGEWLPDLADLDNPGSTEALNVLYESGQYWPYLPLSPSGAVLSHLPVAAYRATGSGGTEVHVATNDFNSATALYVGSGAGASSWTDITGPTPSATDNRWTFTQYNEEVFATSSNEIPRVRTLASGSAFVNLSGTYGNAPKAAVCGVVGQFLVLGDQRNASVGAPYSIQWSSIDTPHDWPTPNSTQAIAAQSGQQFFKPKYGSVLGISEGDQWSIVLMDGSLQRMSFQGGDDVFGFDTIYQGPGPTGQDAWVKFGPMVYFASEAGFMACDGTTVYPIGRNKVDKYFASQCDFNNFNLVRVGVHWYKRLIYWTFPTHGSSGVPAEMIVYNVDEKKFTHVQDAVQCFVSGEEASQFNGIEAFSHGKQCGFFVAAAGIATMASPEIELNPGGKALVQGVRPHVTGGFLSNVAISIGSRNNQNDSVSYMAASAADSFTGSANAIVDARYHRAKFDISGNFTNVIGGEVEAQSSSDF